jgi:hypothetical protein
LGLTKNRPFPRIIHRGKRTRGDAEIHLPRAEADCANDSAQLVCEADHSTEPVIDWSQGPDNQHRRVLQSLQVENTKLRNRAVDLVLEIEKIREAKNSRGNI